MKTWEPSFESAVASTLGNWPRRTLFLAAVSGGADSTAMLAALSALRRQGGFRLRCLHVEHGLRPPDESRGDAKAVRDLCKALEVPCRVISVAPGKIAETAKKRGLGIEGAARLYRHRAWNGEARRLGAERILVAHTGDDVLETVLMRILRGSGPVGLAPMPRERGLILRPLRDLSRVRALRYLEERKLPFRTDSTNGDDRFLRNRIRLRLIPCLDEFFPHWKKTLLFFAETQGLAADFLRAEAERRIPWRGGGGGLLTPWDAFFSEPPIMREEALFRGADLLNAGPLSGGGVLGEDSAAPRRAGLRRFCAGAGAADAGPVRMERKGAFLSLLPRHEPVHDWGFSLLIKGPGVYKLKGLIFRVQGPAEFAGLVPGGSKGLKGPKELAASKAPPAWGERGFFARLPLALRRHWADDFILQGGQKRRLSDILDGVPRSSYTGIFTAEDQAGPAAFIAVRENAFSILLNREKDGPREDLFFILVSAEAAFSTECPVESFVPNIGGIDVQQ